MQMTSVTKEIEMPYDYIKRSYDFQPEVGRRVRQLETGNSGVIARENRSMSHYVMVRFDERKHSTPCHPSSLEYLPEPVSAHQ
jgi:hypothetical protein